MKTLDTQKVVLHQPSPHAKQVFRIDIHLQRHEQLSRIRENQRRSRTRKQEHIRELEQQLVSLKEQSQQKDVDHRLAMQKLETENRRLRGLLSSAGIESGVVNGYLQMNEGNDSVAGRKIAIPVLRRGRTQEDWGACTHPLAEGRSYNSKQPKTPEDDLPYTSRSPTTESVRSQSVCGCSADEDSWPANEDILNTTLCAIAEELISQYNTRGVEVAEIQKKLWAGFSRGAATGDGCRVQNQILFQVLDDISDH